MTMRWASRQCGRTSASASSSCSFFFHHDWFSYLHRLYFIRSLSHGDNALQEACLLMGRTVRAPSTAEIVVFKSASQPPPARRGWCRAAAEQFVPLTRRGLVTQHNSGIVGSRGLLQESSLGSLDPTSSLMDAGPIQRPATFVSTRRQRHTTSGQT